MVAVSTRTDARGRFRRPDGGTHEGELEMTIESGCPMSRRRLFGVLGAGAATAMGAGTLAPAQARAAINTAVRPDRFGRLFGDLEPFADATPRVVAALKALGAPGGPMDAHDDLASGPLNLILNPGPNRDNPTMTAGMTFIGQFIDHDLTLDATSPLGEPTEPQDTVNQRSPAFDLDSVYGSGPFGDPIMYEPDRRTCAWARAARTRTSRAYPTAPRSSATPATTRTRSSTACM